MAENKKYYWLRLHDDFFDSIRIKKLRKMAGGDTFTIIYLKIQLVAMKKGGVLTYTGLEEDFASELALDIDEDVENVKITLAYLLRCGLAETSDNVGYYFPYAVLNTGSETAGAQRVRECRERKALQCNTDVTPCNTDVTTLKRRDIDIEREIDIDIDRKERVTHARFAPPTVEEVKAYCLERKNKVDPERFVDFYSSKGWRVGNQPMKDWKAAVRTWEKREDNANPSAGSTRYGNFDPEEALQAALKKTYG